MRLPAESRLGRLDSGGPYLRSPPGKRSWAGPVLEKETGSSREGPGQTQSPGGLGHPRITAASIDIRTRPPGPPQLRPEPKNADLGSEEKLGAPEQDD